MLTGGTVELIFRERVFISDKATGNVESITVNVGFVVPSVPLCGVPLIVPGERRLKAKPFGKAGRTDQVKGRVPPVACKVVGG